VGEGCVERVPPAVWHYEVSGKHVLRQWFSHRQKDRSRFIMGARRPPSKLGEVQPDFSGARYALARASSTIAVDQHTINTAAARCTRSQCH
jgi:hypothetical protein